MTEDHIFRAIQLSLLEKDKKEQAAFHTTIERVLSFVAAVADVDLPKQQSSPERVSVFRDDVVTVPRGTYREPMLAQAPAKHLQWFLSKKILP